jgi:hypothetical protein
MKALDEQRFIGEIDPEKPTEVAGSLDPNRIAEWQPPSTAPQVDSGNPFLGGVDLGYYGWIGHSCSGIEPGTELDTQVTAPDAVATPKVIDSGWER